MKRLHLLEGKKKNQEQQIKNDVKYNELVGQVTQLCKTIHYAQVTFSLPYQPQMILLELLSELKTAATRGAIEEDYILQTAKKLKPIQEQVKKEWAKHYPSIVESISSTLKIIQKIDPIQITKCLFDIRSAEQWLNTDDDLPHLKALANALESSHGIITKLNLDQEITAFLTKVSSNAATLNDLTDTILAWIRSENLSDRIEISFK